MFMDEDDDSETDKYVNVLESRSKLASIFKLSGIEQNEPKSLNYVAPKAPKADSLSVKTLFPKVNIDKSPIELKLILAVPVTAYKYEENQPVCKGKVGAALLGCHQTKTFRLLLYYQKQEWITSASISLNFKFELLVDNFGHFYNEKLEGWSVQFQSNEDQIEFSKQIALAKAWSCNLDLKTVIFQDIQLGIGLPIGKGDPVEIRYTSYILQPDKLGEVISSDIFQKLKVGKSKSIPGWNEGLNGMKLTGRRRIVMTPKDHRVKTVRTECLVFDVELVRVKSQSDSKVTSPCSSPVPGDTPRSSQPDVAKKEPVDDKKVVEFAPNVDVSSGEEDHKPNIVTRIARMGTAVLPGNTPFTGDTMLDGDKTHPTHSGFEQVAREIVQSVPRTEKHATPLQQKISQNMSEGFNPTYPPYSSQIRFGSSEMKSALVNSSFPMLTADESGSSLMEIKSLLDQLDKKVEDILSKVGHPQVDEDGISSLDYKLCQRLLGAEDFVLSLKNLIVENAILKTRTSKEPSSTDAAANNDPAVSIESISKSRPDEIYSNMLQLKSNNEVMKANLNSKCEECELLTQKYQECEKMVDEVQRRTIHDEEKQTFLAKQLDDMTIQYEKLYLEKEATDRETRKLKEQLGAVLTSSRNKSKQQIVEKLKDIIKCDEMQLMQDEFPECPDYDELMATCNKLELEVQTKHLSVEKLQKTINDLQKKVKNLEPLEDQVLNWRKKFDEAMGKMISVESYQEKMIKGTVDHLDDLNRAVVSEVKKVMNIVYHRLQTHFETEETYLGREVRSTLLVTIKDLTLGILKKYESLNQERVGSASPKLSASVEREHSGKELKNEDSPLEISYQPLLTLGDFAEMCSGDPSTPEEPNSPVETDPDTSPVRDMTEDEENDTAKVSFGQSVTILRPRLDHYSEAEETRTSSASASTAEEKSPSDKARIPNRSKDTTHPVVAAGGVKWNINRESILEKMMKPEPPPLPTSSNDNDEDDEDDLVWTHSVCDDD